jgi:hypothetical protein
LKRIALLAVFVFSLALVSQAAPLPTLNLTETFQSGATFNGTVTFLSDYSNMVAVTGVLSGGPYGTDSINWIWDQTANFASSFGPQYGGNFLMDGTTCGNECGSFNYFITITWDFSAAPNLQVVTPAADPLSAIGGNNINYVDPLVSGSFSTPEPGSLALLGSGVVGLAGLLRRKFLI